MVLPIRPLLRENPNLLVSGGAIGADTVFGDAAICAGFNVLHFTFDEHLTNAQGYIVRLSAHQLWKNRKVLVATARRLGRRFPTKSEFTNKLLLRNYYQVNRTKTVYAVAKLDKELYPEGGSAWACAMLNHKIPLFFFDQNREQWFYRNSELQYKLLDDNPPEPQGIVTGIGTRKLNEAGENAIRQLFKS